MAATNGVGVFSKYVCLHCSAGGSRFGVVVDLMDQIAGVGVKVRIFWHFLFNCG